jgi:hypothetical protein
MEGKTETMCTSEVGSERPGSCFGCRNRAIDFQVRNDMWDSQHSGCGGNDDNEISRSTTILANFDFTQKQMAWISYLREAYKLKQGLLKT